MIPRAPIACEQLTSALGAPYADERVQQLAKAFGISKVPQATAKEPDSDLVSQSHGIELQFIDGDSLAGNEVNRFGNAPMVLVSIVLYPTDGTPGFKPYRGQLPGGGSVDDLFEAHVANLGPPTETIEDDGDLVSRSWLLDGFWLSFAYQFTGALRAIGLELASYRALMRSK